MVLWVAQSRTQLKQLRKTAPIYLTIKHIFFSSVQLLSCIQLFVTPRTAARQASLSITTFRRLLKLKSIKSVMLSNHLILCRPLLLLPSIFPSRKTDSSSESVLHIRRLKYWSFNFSISPSNVYSGLISFRMDWLDLLAVQRTLKSLLQCNSSKASIIPYSAFLWHPTPVLLPGKSHGWRSLVGCSPWGC